MDIRYVTDAEKRGYIDRVNQSFEDIKKTIITLSHDMESDDLKTQATAVWIGGQLCSWYSDFIKEIRKLDQLEKTRKDLESEIKGAVEHDTTIN